MTRTEAPSPTTIAHPNISVTTAAASVASSPSRITTNARDRDRPVTNRPNNQRIIRAPEPPADDTVSLATPDDLPYIVWLQKRWSHAVGFLTRATLRSYLEDRRVIILHRNALEAGYLAYRHTHRGILRIIQTAVDHDLLRSTLGSQALSMLVAIATHQHASIIRLKCRANLDANRFWNASGFLMTAILDVANTRGHPLLEWTYYLTNAPINAVALPLHAPPNTPACGR